MIQTTRIRTTDNPQQHTRTNVQLSTTIKKMDSESSRKNLHADTFTRHTERTEI